MNTVDFELRCGIAIEAEVTDKIILQYRSFVSCLVWWRSRSMNDDFFVPHIMYRTSLYDLDLVDLSKVSRQGVQTNLI